jgi:hypothetical protein
VRTLVVAGAVGIVCDAQADLGKKRIDFNPNDKADFVKKMMIITCSE